MVISDAPRKPAGWYVSYKKWNFFLPFICHRCGRCCEAPSPRCVAWGLWAIADHLNTSIEKLVLDRFQNMLEFYIDDEGHERLRILDGFDENSCPFLSEEKLCEVYAARPEGCQSFPLETDFGAADVECLGDQEFKRVLQSYRRRNPMYSAGSRPQGKQPPVGREWRFILKRLMEAKPSRDLYEQFVEINNIPKELV